VKRIHVKVVTGRNREAQQDHVRLTTRLPEIYVQGRTCGGRISRIRGPVSLIAAIAIPDEPPAGSEPKSRGPVLMCSIPPTYG